MEQKHAQAEQQDTRWNASGWFTNVNKCARTHQERDQTETVTRPRP